MGSENQGDKYNPSQGSVDKFNNAGFIQPENPPPYSPYPPSTPSTVPLLPIINININPNHTVQEVLVPVAEPVNLHPNRILLNGATKEERTVFLRKVYSVLVGKSIIMIGFMALFLYIPDLNSAVDEMSWWKFWSFWIGGVLIASMITAFDQYTRQPPGDILLLTIIACGSGVLFGTLSARIETEKIMVDVGIVGIICLAVILFTFQTKFFYTPTHSFFYVGSCLLAAFGFLCIGYSVKNSLWIMGAPTFFFIYVIAATQYMIKDTRLNIHCKEYIYTAVTVCMYFVSLIGKVIRACPCFKRCPK